MANYHNLGRLPLLLLGLSACSVGYKYSYKDSTYTMNSENIEYHKKVMRDAQAKFDILLEDSAVIPFSSNISSYEIRQSFIPRKKKELKTLTDACSYLKKAALNSPEAGSFGSAQWLITKDAQTVCSRRDNTDEQLQLAIQELQKRAREEKRAEEEAKRKEEAEIKRKIEAQRREEARKAEAIRQQRWTELVLPVLKKCEAPRSVIEAKQANVKKSAESYAERVCKIADLTDSEAEECRSRCASKAVLSRMEHDLERAHRQNARQQSSSSRPSAAPSPRTSVEDRVRCIQRCEPCNTNESIMRWGSVSACLPIFERCANDCGCNNLGPHVTSLAEACQY